MGLTNWLLAGLLGVNLLQTIILMWFLSDAHRGDL